MGRAVRVDIRGFVSALRTLDLIPDFKALQLRLAGAANSSDTAHRNPGTTSSPCSEPAAEYHLRISVARRIVTERRRGSTNQTGRVPSRR